MPNFDTLRTRLVCVCSLNVVGGHRKEIKSRIVDMIEYLVSVNGLALLWIFGNVIVLNLFTFDRGSMGDPFSCCYRLIFYELLGSGFNELLIIFLALFSFIYNNNRIKTSKKNLKELLSILFPRYFSFVNVVLLLFFFLFLC